MLSEPRRINTSSVDYTQTSCRHCGHDLYSASELKDGFCCLGCKAAYQLINGLGLDYFYCLREQSGLDTEAPVLQSTSSFKHFDGPEFFARFVKQESPEVSRIDFQSPAIHCSACVWLLEKLPEVVPGITSTRVDLTRARVSIWFEPAAVKLPLIAKTLSELGYEPHPLGINTSNRLLYQSDVTFSLQLGVAAFCAMNVMLLFIGRYQGLFSGMEKHYQSLFAWVSFALTIPAVTFSALPFFRTSLAGLRMGRLHLDLPISLAIIGGFTASAINTILGRSEVYFDSVTALVFLLLVGRWFQRRGMKKVALASDMLYAIAPISAKKITDTGSEEVFVESLKSGDKIIVPNNVRIPCDGKVLSDNGIVNNALITGESRPTRILQGEMVFCGAVNCGPVLTVEVSAVGDSSRLGNLIRSIESNPQIQGRMTQFTDRVAKYFVVGVLAVALMTFVAFAQSDLWSALDRVFALLIVSCPCALGIATPIVLSLAAARAAQSGILLRDGTALERIALVNRIYFDKTGTLTFGNLSLADAIILNPAFSEHQVWQTVSNLEYRIEHPIAQALIRHSESMNIMPQHIMEPSSVAGFGVKGQGQGGLIWRIGALDWLKTEGVMALPQEHFTHLPDNIAKQATVIGLSRENELIAVFSLCDTLRPEAFEVIHELSERKISSAILSGDSSRVVQNIAQKLSIPLGNAIGAMTPERKAALIKSEGPTAALIGDGINDALALANAGVGIGIKGGAEICLTVSDVFLLNPNLKLLITLIDGARASMRHIRLHLFISLIYNLSAASLAICGLIGPLAAALIMPASSLSVILSSLWRAPFKKDNQWK